MKRIRFHFMEGRRIPKPYGRAFPFNLLIKYNLRMGAAARRLGVGTEILGEHKAKAALYKADSLFFGGNKTVLKNKSVDYKSGN